LCVISPWRATRKERASKVSCSCWRNNSKTQTKTEILLFLNLEFIDYLFVSYLFVQFPHWFLLVVAIVTFVIVGFLFLLLPHYLFFFSLSTLSTLPSSSSHPYSHPLHSPSFYCAKNPVPLSNNSFCPLLSTLFLQPSPSPPILL
jgi:hypothetical protein